MNLGGYSFKGTLSTVQRISRVRVLGTWSSTVLGTTSRGSESYPFDAQIYFKKWNSILNLGGHSFKGTLSTVQGISRLDLV